MTGSQSNSHLPCHLTAVVTGVPELAAGRCQLRSYAREVTGPAAATTSVLRW